uniref:Aminotransferase-like plant mobile domain-containing protein n=1 Tax=Fagus sylvatica TaxID=28930 RepID=A0A2N9H139_FAGSY
MQHISGKLSTSSFQRYKVCMNRSSDERVMAPGSRGIGAVFVHFSGEDSDQTGDAFGEPRVPRRSWSRYLSNAPGLVDQLVASRKDSAREGGYFDVLGTVGKLALPTFARFRVCGNPSLDLYRPCTEASLGSQDMILRTEAVGMFLMPRGHLLTEIPVQPEELLTIRKLRAVAEVNLLPKGLGSWTKLQADRKRIFAQTLPPKTPIDDQFSPIRPTDPVWKFIQTIGEKLGFETCQIAIGWSDPAWKFIQTIGEKLGFETCQIAIGWSDPVWKFIQTIGEKLGFETCQIAIGWSDPVWKFIQTIGENWDWDLRLGSVESQLGGQTRFGNSSKRSGKNWSNRFETWVLVESQLGGQTRFGNSSKRSGKNWDLRLVKSQLGGQTRFGNSSKRSGKNWDLRLVKSQLGGQTRLPGFSDSWIVLLCPLQMSDRGSGSGGHRRSDRLAKGKSVIYAPESPPDTDDEYDAMEDVRTRVDASLARDLQAEFDAEAAGLSSSTARPSSRPGITIGRSARPSSAPRQPTAAPPAAPPARSKRRKSDRAPLSADPIPEDHVVPGFRYPPQGGIRPRYPVTTPVVDTPLLTNLHNHPSSSVRRCQDPPESIGRGGWSEFSQLLDIARPEYRDFLVELGFGPFLSIRYVHVRHPLVRCWVERFFHHTGTIHLSTCEVGVLPVDWSAILGIRFGGRIPPSDPVSDFEALEILGIDDPAAIVGKKLFYLKISYLKDLLVREIEEPPTELRYRQWTAYFIFSCFLGNDKSTIPTPIVGMFRDIDDLRDYDWGALTYGFYIRGLRRFSRRETASFLGFWQFTLFWAFEHFAVFAPSRLPAAPDSAFPLARRWDSAWIQRLTTRTLMECRTTVDCIRDVDIVFQPYSTFLLERPEVFRAMELSRLRIWIRSPRSWELLMGERTLRQLGGDALVPVDPPQLMTIEDYIPRAPSDSFVAGVEAYPALILADVPYREWFEQVSLGSLMSLHEVEGGRVMGGSAMDSHLSRSSGEFEWLQTEILRLQLELSVSEDRYAADMARAQEETARVQAELTQTIRRLEDQLHGMGITPVTGAGSSGLGQTSSSPPPDPVSRDWFFDDPPSL